MSPKRQLDVTGQATVRCHHDLPIAGGLEPPQATLRPERERLVKVYELFAQPGGGFSNQTADHVGTIYAVAADSNEQAHELAGKDHWAAGPDDPVGILWVYRRGAQSRDHQLFNGDRVWGNEVHEVHHGAGKTDIVAWMRGILRRSRTR